jgi:HEAT repeat protein
MVIASAAGPTRGESSDAARGEAPPVTALDLEALRAELETGDPDRIHAALDVIQSASGAGRPAAPLVEQLLRRGATIPVLVHALAVAGQVGTPDTSRVIAPYMRHRVEKVRWAAARALGSTGGRAAELALKAGLRSSAARLRELSAEALGRAHAQRALGDLLTALGRGVKAASKASGQVCDAYECLELVRLLEQLGLERVRNGLAAVLSRPDQQAPTWVKLTIVDSVAELQSTPARVFLTQARGRAEATLDEPLKHALDQALERFETSELQPAGRSQP